VATWLLADPTAAAQRNSSMTVGVSTPPSAHGERCRSRSDARPRVDDLDRSDGGVADEVDRRRVHIGDKQFGALLVEKSAKVRSHFAQPGYHDTPASEACRAGQVRKSGVHRTEHSAGSARTWIAEPAFSAG
jgi:hypothetical protein